MARQLIKGMTMLMLLVALAFVTAVVSAQAQTPSVANVPFEFVAADKSMPAGRYLISNNNPATGDIVKIASRMKDASLFALTTRVQASATQEKGKLVFHRYGNRYFLAEIWTAGTRDGQKLRKSREEKSIERELASITSKSEIAQSRFERVEVTLGQQ
jgi:hypothetical protein